MTCGCTENKNLNKDKLSLDAMKGLSIDVITSLYKQDYALESTESVEEREKGGNR